MKITPINNSMIFFYNRRSESSITKAASNPITQITELSNIYYPPVNFTSRKKINRKYSTSNMKLREKPSDFLPLKIDNIPCPCCGKIMLPLKKFNIFAEELAKLPKEEYLNYIGKYRKYMRPLEESVYDELVNLSKKPNSSKDIRTLLVELRETKLPILQEAQRKQINKMKSISKNLPQNERIPLNKKIKNLEIEIHKKNSLAPFRRKVMIDRISKVKISNPQYYEKLQIAAKNFPTSKDMNSAWIIKYSGKNKMDQPWDSYSIALRMLSASVPNTDHILAYSKYRNHDDISNYLAMHTNCNTAKADKSFLQWYHEDPKNRVKNLTRYFTKIQDLIDKNYIKKKRYKNYVAYATNTINNASEHKVVINIPSQKSLNPSRNNKQKDNNPVLNKIYTDDIDDYLEDE